MARHCRASEIAFFGYRTEILELPEREIHNL